jgi:hypothetical protein
VAPAPMALEFAKVAEAPGPTAVALRPVAVAPSPKAAPPFAALAAAPTATEPVATAPLPIAMELTPVLWLAPMAIAPFALATALAPSAVAPLPLPILFAPSAVARVPLALAFVPTAVAFAPLAWAFAPQPKDDADAEAPLLLPVTELTTGVVVGVTFVRMGAVVTLMLLTTALGVEVRPVIALANVGAVVPLVKNVPGCVVRVVPSVKNVFGVEVTLCTNCCDVSVPFKTDAFVSVMLGVGTVVLTNSTAPLPCVVLVPLGKAKNVLGGFALGSNAGTVRLLGWPAGGVMPVTAFPRVAPVSTFPVPGTLLRGTGYCGSGCDSRTG